MAVVQRTGGMLRASLVGLALLGTACGGPEEIGLAEPDALAFADDPVATLSEDDAWWVAFEAVQLCATQRTTHDTVDGPEQALDAALAETGRSRADYDDFSIRLQTEQALRDAVRFTHQQTCMG